MAEAYTGEIRIFAGTFPPYGWAMCDGSQLSIQQNTALFAIIGTTYGGDGKTYFNLPDLRGRAPMHYGHGGGLTPRIIGEMVGSSTVTLNTTELPRHKHIAQGSSQATGGVVSPANAIWGGSSPFSKNPYVNTANPTPMNATIMQSQGGGQPHNNMQPYLAMNFIICLQGNFPPRP